MRAAILARKSTDDSDKDLPSTARQIDECRALIARQGWTVAEEHVHREEATSGALFNRQDRPGLFAILDAIREQPPFDVLVPHAGDRLGREQIEAGWVSKQIIDSGVRMFFSDGHERKLDTATDKLMMAISNFGAEFERERGVARTKGSWFAKVKLGHNMGVPPLGYASVLIGSHKELRIDPATAELVREIFTLTAQGHGVARIAAMLNARPETAQLRKWNGAGIRDILNNEIYIGRFIFGKTARLVKKGRKLKLHVPREQWQVIDMPHLRILDDAIWSAAKARKQETFSTYLRGEKGRLQGRPEKSTLASKFLLSGMVVCAECRRNMVGWSIVKKGKRYSYFLCASFKHRGVTACSNNRQLPMERLNSIVVHQLQHDVLTPKRIAAVSQDLADEANSSVGVEKRVALVAELRESTRRVENLTEGLAAGGSGIEAIVKAIRKAEEAQKTLQARLAALDAAQANLALARDHAERVEALRDDWSKALSGAPAIARQVLRKLLLSPIVVKAQPDGSWFYAAAGSFDRIMHGTITADGSEAFMVGARRGDEGLTRELAELVRAWEAQQAGLETASLPDSPSRRSSA